MSPRSLALIPVVISLMSLFPPTQGDPMPLLSLEFLIHKQPELFQVSLPDQTPPCGNLVIIPFSDPTPDLPAFAGDTLTSHFKFETTDVRSLSEHTAFTLFLLYDHFAPPLLLKDLQ